MAVPLPGGPVPELPAAEVQAPAADTRDGVVILSGIEPRFNQEAVQRTRDAAETGDAVWHTHRSAAFRGTWASSC